MKKLFKINKRDGSSEDFDAEKINKVLIWATEGIKNVSYSEIAINARISLFDGIKSSDIHDLLITSTKNLISATHPNYSKVGARLLNYKLRKLVWKGKNPPKLYNLVKRNITSGHYDPDLLDQYSEQEMHKLDEWIDHDRDDLFEYAGIQQFVDKYLVQDRNSKEILDTPQFAYMLIAMTLFANEKKNRLNIIRSAYNEYSKHIVNLSTPILAGARTKTRSYSSCCLIEVDDTKDSLFASNTAAGLATCDKYGIGLGLHNQRTINAPIRNGETLHSGAIPWLKNYQSTIASCQQGGARRGAGTVTKYIFDPQIEDILQLKNNTGTDENRVRHLDYAIGMSRLFWERFINDDEITLMSSHEAREVYDSFGTKEFDKIYLEYEKKDLKFSRRVKAKDIIHLLAKERFETGRIYVLNLDQCNDYSPWLGRVSMSNLCVTGDQRVVSNLGMLTAKELYDNGSDLILFDNQKEVKSSPMELIGKYKKVYKIHLNNGMSHTITDYHKVLVKKDRRNNLVKQCKDLNIGDEIAIQTNKGIFGTLSMEDEAFILGSFPSDDLPDWIWESNESTILSYFKGLFMYNESIIKTDRLSYSSSSKDFLKKLQLLISNLGIHNCIEKLNDEWVLKINESAEKYYKIDSIEYVGREDVYCCKVESDEHLWVCNGVITHNCVEILHSLKPFSQMNSDDGEIGVCVLSAVNMLKINSDKEHEKTCEIIVRMLDNLIDNQDYFDKAAERFAKNKRSIGVGITNMAGWLASQGFNHCSPEAPELVNQFLEKQQYFLLKASNKLAEERGSAPDFDQTKYSQGKMPLDMYNKNVDEFLSVTALGQDKWDELKLNIDKYGLRNCTLSCQMPCESSSCVQSSTNGQEPIKNLITYKKSKTTPIPVLAPSIVKWKNRYIKAYDMPDNEGMIKINAAVCKWLCMSSSFNLYYRGEVTFEDIIRDLLIGTKYGAKTFYYSNNDDDDVQSIEKDDKADCGCTL